MRENGIAASARPYRGSFVIVANRGLRWKCDHESGCVAKAAQFVKEARAAKASSGARAVGTMPRLALDEQRPQTIACSLLIWSLTVDWVSRAAVQRE
jgi:hypothetical protein